MKNTVAILLAIVLMLFLTGCGNTADHAPSDLNGSVETQEEVSTVEEDSANVEKTPDDEPEPVEEPQISEEEESAAEPEPAVEPESVSEDDLIEDDAWDELEALGKVKTEDGVFYVTVTLPPDLVGTEITQETLDTNAGENYISAKLNDDGSVSYQMTKKQHKVMLDGLVESFEESIQKLIDEDTFSYTKIDHNKNFTQFDVTISGTELNLSDSLGTIAFYMYGGYYGLFSGHEADNVIVNIYDGNGTLIETADSSNIGS